MQKRNPEFDTVLDLCIETKKIMYIASPGNVDFIQLPAREFNKYKFELIKYLKKLPKPEDRYLPYEIVDQDNVYSLEKELAIMKSRQTKEEQDEEQSLNNKLKEQDNVRAR